MRDAVVLVAVVAFMLCIGLYAWMAEVVRKAKRNKKLADSAEKKAKEQPKT